MIRELAHRTGDRIGVTLLWNTRRNQVFVSVVDERRQASFQFEVDGGDALDDFHHPYAYPARRSDETALAA
jgi:hypothetical protein